MHTLSKYPIWVNLTSSLSFKHGLSIYVILILYIVTYGGAGDQTWDTGNYNFDLSVEMPPGYSGTDARGGETARGWTHSGPPGVTEGGATESANGRPGHENPTRRPWDCGDYNFDLSVEMPPGYTGTDARGGTTVNGLVQGGFSAETEGGATESINDLPGHGNPGRRPWDSGDYNFDLSVGMPQGNTGTVARVGALQGSKPNGSGTEGMLERESGGRSGFTNMSSNPSRNLEMPPGYTGTDARVGETANGWAQGGAPDVTEGGAKTLVNDADGNRDPGRRSWDTGEYNFAGSLDMPPAYTETDKNSREIEKDGASGEKKDAASGNIGRDRRLPNWDTDNYDLDVNPDKGFSYPPPPYTFKE